MTGMNANEGRKCFWVQLAGLLESLALLLEMAASADYLDDGNSLTAKTARLVAIGLRMAAKLAHR
ncbi:hypothetical protein GCM10027258_24290 [Amycolatopsis stemonae]